MTKPLAPFLVLSIALAGCSGDESPAASGAGGSTSGPVTTGATGTATSGSTASGSTGTSGAGGAGGNVSGGTGGSEPGDASADDGGAGGSRGGSAGSTGAGGAAGRYGWYEAEAVPPNQLYGRAVKATCQASCPSLDTIKPGDACCSGGGEVNWIVSGGKGPDPQPPDGRGGGELRYNAISAPADGMYDVTWWYHCGANDNFGDHDCGGQTDPPTTSSGCRPHQIIVNGVEMPGTYHFPCFAGSWGIIHAATTTVPLKAGNLNWIHVYATKPRDAADMDAIEILPVGKGVPPLVKSNSDPIGH
jgi:hypothetical protein